MSPSLLKPDGVVVRQMRFHWGHLAALLRREEDLLRRRPRAAVGAVPDDGGLVELLLLLLVGPVAGRTQGAVVRTTVLMLGRGSPLLEAMVRRGAVARAALAMVVVARNMTGGMLYESCLRTALSSR